MKVVSLSFSFLRPLLVSLVMVCWFGCAPQSSEQPPANQQGFGLSGGIQPDDFYCPEGYSYDGEYHLCEGQKGVLGPFSDAMIQRCKSFGGGSPCDGVHWQREFAHSIRGTGKCPNGTQWETELEVCYSGENVFGPFLRSQHERCVSAGGGPACETMRWSRQFFNSIGLPPSKGASSAGLDFTIPEPEDADIVDAFTLWATYYRIPTVRDLGSSGIPLLDMNGQELGASLSRRDWCHAALEGSVRVLDFDGNDTVYNYSGSRESYRQTDCSDYISMPQLSYSRFYRAKGHFGDGVSGYHLKPYRTIAVDPSYVPYGSVIFIPAAKGTRVVLPNGQQAIHDGYFFAADTGGALHGKHIDVFIGSALDNPFSFVKSTSSGLFKVYLVQSAAIKDRLKTLHQVP
ncbi:MAG: 3D domain-containing protein [Silvanigrellaceae bacterium]